jgi:stearoyl-CoA desaturase (delta-9 desaturase)
LDVHSPKHAGFLFSHVGWIFSRQKGQADYSLVPDLTRFPELRWLDRHPYLPAFLLAVGCFVVDGWAGLFVGFFLSTVLLYHGTFAINSLAHVVGRRRYVTGDESRNNWWLALITLGEGWHNNHHHYQSSTRQGFFWWEIDPSYYLLKALERLGVVWDLRAPPEEVVRGENRLGRRVVEKEARQLAEMFSLEGMVSELERVWDQLPGFRDAVQRLKGARPAAFAHLKKKRKEITAQFEALHLPDFPSVDEIRARLTQRYRDTPGLDDVAERVQEILLEKILVRLAPRLNPGSS